MMFEISKGLIRQKNSVYPLVKNTDVSSDWLSMFTKVINCSYSSLFCQVKSIREL